MTGNLLSKMVLARVALTVLLSLAIHGATAAQEFTPLKPRTEIIDLDGTKVPIVLEPFVNIGGGEGSWTLTAEVRGDLTDLQKQLPGHLKRKASERNEECGDRFHLVRLEPPTPAGGDVLIKGAVRYEKWYCTYAKVPEFRGLKVTFKERRTSKNKIVRETADVIARIFTRVAPDEVRLDAEAVKVDAGHGLLQPLVDALGLDGEVRALATRELREMFSREGFGLSFPKEVRAYDVRFTQAEFVDRGGGSLGLVVRGEVSLTQADVAKLLGLLDALSGGR